MNKIMHIFIIKMKLISILTKITQIFQLNYSKHKIMLIKNLLSIIKIKKIFSFLYKFCLLIIANCCGFLFANS